MYQGIVFENLNLIIKTKWQGVVNQGIVFENLDLIIKSEWQGVVNQGNVFERGNGVMSYDPTAGVEATQ